MELVQLSAEQLTLMGLTIVGITELINRLRAKDLWVAVTIVCSAVVGALLALYWHVDPLAGALAGLAASGTLKTLGSVGNKSTPAPSSVLNKG